MIVPWPPGGVTDVVARFVAEQLSISLGQAVVVENRAGANGVIGTQLAAKASPDGYTLQAVTAETHAINPYVYPHLGYSPMDSFEAVGQVADVSFVLAARGGFEPSTVQQLIALARARPEWISAGSYGVGSTSHLGLALLEKSAGIRLNHIPYQGVAPAVNALLAGQIDVAMVNGFNVAPFVANGRIKIIGVASNRALNILPLAATLDSQGLKGFEAGNWYGYMVPTGTPREVREKLSRALERIANSEPFKLKLDSMGVTVRYRDPDQFMSFIEQENLRMSQVVHQRGIVSSQ
jgi:tripartite-type tricarboxylate transporter receptor subunit TctC